MAWRECKSVVVTCVWCASVPTCGMWALADGFAKDAVGPLFWIVGGFVGIGIGLTAGLLGCVLAANKGVRELLLNEPADVGGAKVVDEARVRSLRYQIGVPLALFGALFGCYFLLDAVHTAMFKRFGGW